METEGSKSSPRAEEPRDGAPVRADLVLLVDDDPVARLLTASALAERNWRVIEADGGASALELFANNQPDVVVLDALMPGVDGFETCARLRGLPGFEHVPVLMLTGLDDDASITRAYEAGATDFFVKVHAVELLSGRLRYMLRASRMRDELAESRAKLSQGAAHRAHGQLRMGHRRALGEAVRGVLRDRRAAAAGRRTGGLVRLVAHGRGGARAHRDVFREALASSGQMNFECRLARPTAAGAHRPHRGRARSRRRQPASPTRHRPGRDRPQQAEDQIRHLANYDSLTGLPNRRFFRDQFQAALERAPHAAARRSACC